MLRRQIILFLGLLSALQCQIHAKDSEQGSIEPPAIGNFALPSSQQPTTFLSFGENIIDEGVAQIYLNAGAFIGKDNYSTIFTPNILYGITDDFSIFLTVPFAPRNKDGSDHSSGIGDISVQLEYAFFSKSTSHSVNQATIVAAIALPTGSASKEPTTGFG